MIEDARLDGRTATITVRFDADIAAVTRNQEGEVVAGSLSDAVETHDVWTFRRTLGSDDPNWLLRSEEHTSELQSLMRISYDGFCLKKNKNKIIDRKQINTTYNKKVVN